VKYLDLSLIEEGGLLMWPILLLSLIGFVLFVERTLHLHRGQIRTSEFIDGIKNLLRKRRLLEALTLCEETSAPVSNVIKAALLHYDEEEGKMLSAVQAAAIVQIPLMERRIGSIAAIARVCPLIGLLGTVLGMFESFSDYLGGGTVYADVAVLANGFSEALITTAAALAIAIVAHLAHHFLSGRVRALVHDMEWAGNDIMQFLLHDLPEEET
tara:strand:+ start:14837 stop:15475 length:639 start_codon:yes stop_codon:yes gene_type:complete